MFSYFRYVGLIGMIVAIIGAAGIGVWSNRLLSSEFLGVIVARQHANIQSFAETIWRDYMPAKSENNTASLELFRQRAADYVKPQDPIKITIFSTDVRSLYYGSTSAYVSTAEGERITLFDIEKIQQGQVAGRIIHNAHLTSDSKKQPRIMVQAIIPILQPGLTLKQMHECGFNAASHCTPEALVEVYTDITKEWNRLTNFQWIAGGCVLTLIVMLALVLMRVTARAESTVAKQHEINEQLTEAAAQAEASSRDKSEFLTSVSHELRTPLNAIIGFSEILKSQVAEKLDLENARYIDDIHGSGTHLLGLINDILDFSKAEAGKLQLDFDEQDLNKIIRNSVRLVIPRAETAQVTLNEELPSESIVISTDGKKLKQVLLNLLANAVKFTPAGGMVKAVMWRDMVDKSVIIEITDTGIGISPKDIPRVLAPFGQVDSKLARQYEGTGLGLPLSKKFVEVMGGKFTLQSEVGKGTTITITLPPESTAAGGEDASEAAENQTKTNSSADSNAA